MLMSKVVSFVEQKEQVFCAPDVMEIYIARTDRHKCVVPGGIQRTGLYGLRRSSGALSVYTCLCVYVYMCVCVHLCVCVSVHLCMCLRVRMFMYVRICVCMYVCACIGVHVCVSMCANVCA